MFQWINQRVNIWVILVSLLVAGGLIALLALLILFLPTPANPGRSAQMVMTVIVAPTPTVSPTVPAATITPTAPARVGGIAIGDFVKITGTGGEGLRIRSGPGTTSDMRFVGMDEEVFRVKDGPKNADGFTWWHLEAPYDPSRNGWAASKYLKVVSAPATPTP